MHNLNFRELRGMIMESMAVCWIALEQASNGVSLNSHALQPRYISLSDSD